MKHMHLNKTIVPAFGKCRSSIAACAAVFLFGAIVQLPPASAQAVLFDFDNAPLHAPLPISLTVSGITAHFSATGQGYSIQDNTAPVVPAGFTGRFIYPSSVYLADLLIGFDQTITDFSIKYSCQELGCDDAATMRVTAYMNGSFVGTNTMTAGAPGTWPADTLSCSFPQGFDSAVVHYDSPPPTCQDYGVIFIADNMRVTEFNGSAIPVAESLIDGLIIACPAPGMASISFSLPGPGNISLTVFDLTGRKIKNLYDGTLSTGEHQVIWDANDDKAGSGVYLLKLEGEHFSRCCRLVVVK